MKKVRVKETLYMGGLTFPTGEYDAQFGHDGSWVRIFRYDAQSDNSTEYATLEIGKGCEDADFYNKFIEVVE